MATPPKKIGNQRITVPGRKVKGKPGRPKGSRKKRQFEETKLGFFLKYEAPLEYDLIMASTPQGIFPEPSMAVIEAVTFASPNPVFKKPKFFRYLDEYEKNKLCIRFPKKLRPGQLERAQERQRKLIMQYIEKRKKHDTYFA